ncbi:MAG: biotin--[Clostridia bacterium]|nr:biotin--[acetyl-CoA-carboxylase] ligase [Clostridia bacterium]
MNQQKPIAWPVRIGDRLATAWAGRRIDYYDTIDSTNTVARRLGRLDPEIAPHGTLVVADEQTRGRGRMDRVWQSRPGEAALMSLLLRPAALAPADAVGIVLVTALAVCDACRSFGADALIKWPNDIVCGGKKICGMLLDMDADADRVRFAVVGVGLNISGYPSAEGLRHASCLNDAAGKVLDRADVIARFLAEFERRYDFWASGGDILPDYSARCVTLGSRVKVAGLMETFEGEALRVLPDGALMVRRDGGEETPVRAGDVSVRGVMDYI